LYTNALILLAGNGVSSSPNIGKNCAISYLQHKMKAVIQFSANPESVIKNVSAYPFLKRHPNVKRIYTLHSTELALSPEN